MQGQLDIPLSEDGLAQSRALAGWLRDQRVEFDALYSSDLMRAQQTARIIGERLGLPVLLSPALREIHCGDWQGLSVAEIEARYSGALTRWRDEVLTFRPPHGESVPDVQRRVCAFARQMLAGNVGKSVIIVSHGHALAALIAGLGGWDLSETWTSKRARLENTGVAALRYDHATGRSEFLFVNSVAHLGRAPAVPAFMDPNA
jgi:broad specificity phosphatase PhoE